ncbi:MAG: hypothetical protein ABH883_06800 [Candidatus Omnitrophota bacterium]
MNIWELCKCNADRICPFCKILIIVCLSGLGIFLGYLIKRRKKKSG